jgi:hypothetical protein
VLAELSFRDLVPAIWLPTPGLRAERERSRYRLHLVKHRSILKNRIHSTLIAFGYQCPVSDLFGLEGRRLLDSMDFPEPWRGHVDASMQLIDELEVQIAQIEHKLKRIGADHAYVPLLLTAPGFGWITSFTVACEIGDINRFSSPVKLTGYTGLCPRVNQSGEVDRRGPPRARRRPGLRQPRWLSDAARHHEPVDRSRRRSRGRRREPDRDVRERGRRARVHRRRALQLRGATQAGRLAAVAHQGRSGVAHRGASLLDEPSGLQLAPLWGWRLFGDPPGTLLCNHVKELDELRVGADVPSPVVAIVPAPTRGAEHRMTPQLGDRRRTG